MKKIWNINEENEEKVKVELVLFLFNLFFSIICCIIAQ